MGVHELRTEGCLQPGLSGSAQPGLCAAWVLCSLGSVLPGLCAAWALCCLGSVLPGLPTDYRCYVVQKYCVTILFIYLEIHIPTMYGVVSHAEYESELWATF